MQESPMSISEPTVCRTPAEAFRVSCNLAASQARHAHEVQASNPFAELKRYLDNPLEWDGIDMLEFWKVSSTQSSLILLMIGYVG